MIYFVGFVLIYLLKVLLKLNIWVCLMLGIYGFMMVPLYRKRARKIREFRQRFYEVSLYLDTILYAFVKEEKVHWIQRRPSVETSPRSRAWLPVSSQRS